MDGWFPSNNHPTSRLLFFPVWMTFHAILEIIDPLIQMFLTYLPFIMFMTAIAGIGRKTGLMAGGTTGSVTMI